VSCPLSGHALGLQPCLNIGPEFKVTAQIDASLEVSDIEVTTGLNYDLSGVTFAFPPQDNSQAGLFAHERVSLVHVDVADATTRMGLDIEVDHLHEYTCAHVVQERVLVVRAKERRIRESVRARGFGEGQLGPRWCMGDGRGEL